MSKQKRIAPIVTEKKQEKSQAVVIKKMRYYSNDPAFKKKDEEAKAFLEKHGLPEAFTQKK